MRKNRFPVVGGMCRETKTIVPLENLSCTNPKIYSGSLGSL